MRTVAFYHLYMILRATRKASVAKQVADDLLIRYGLTEALVRAYEM